MQVFCSFSLKVQIVVTFKSVAPACKSSRGTANLLHALASEKKWVDCNQQNCGPSIPWRPLATIHRSNH